MRSCARGPVVTWAVLRVANSWKVVSVLNFYINVQCLSE